MSADDEADTAEDTADTDSEEPEITEDTADTVADDEADTAEDTDDTDNEEPETTEVIDDTAADDEADTDTAEPEMTEVTDDTATDDEADTVEDTADTDTVEPEMTEDTDDTADDEADTTGDSADTDGEEPKMSEETYDTVDDNEADTTQDIADTDGEAPEMSEETYDRYADDEADTAEDTTDTDAEQPEMTEDTYDAGADEVKQERSFADKVKDFVKGPDSAYDVQRYEQAGIRGAFNDVPRNRREAVYNRFEQAPQNVKDIVNEYSDRLSVGNTVGQDCCHFNMDDKTIYMEKNLDNDEYSEVFSHEYGHFVDDQKGNISDTAEFRNAIQNDLAMFDRSTDQGKANFDNMLNDLFASDAAYDRAISDNLSAYFINDPEIMQRYFDEGIPYYRHDNSYWRRGGNREAELFANNFSMYAQNNTASTSFMEKYFSNTWNHFRKTL